ncbi:MAG: dephospho-CoA kinase [Bacteroidota bacterium]
MALKVGLTGGIGSGKSIVAQMFEALGIPVYYADDETKNLYLRDQDLKQSLINNFGPETYTDNIFNASYLRQIVFTNPEKLELLNSLVHPAIIKDAASWFSKQTTPYVIKEAALIFESGSQRDLDFVIGVTAPVELRINRVMKRDKLTREEVQSRMQQQIEDRIKIKLCDYLIVNDDSKPLLPQVLALHEKLLERC